MIGYEKFFLRGKEIKADAAPGIFFPIAKKCYRKDSL